jgi:Sulfatase
LIVAAIPVWLTAQQKRPPNIILILIDDFGWTDLSCYGSTFYQSPNIDQLAVRGARWVEQLGLRENTIIVFTRQKCLNQEYL